MKKSKTIAPILACVAAGMLSILSGCGTTGKTTVASIMVRPTEQLEYALEVGSVALEENSTRVDAVGTLPWGEFSRDDLQNIQLSLQNALASMQRYSPPVADKKLFIHVLLRHYLVTSSNTAGAALADVAWCVVDEKKHIVFHEAFYASNAVKFVGTLGGMKNKVNEVILMRIATMSAYLASPNANAGNAQPAMPLNTFLEFDQAIQRLPRNFKSFYVIASYGYPFLYDIGKPAHWDWASSPNPVNWEERLGLGTASRPQ